MNLVVHKASHPQLRDYINSAVNGLLPFIQQVSCFVEAYIHFEVPNYLCFRSFKKLV